MTYSLYVDSFLRHQVCDVLNGVIGSPRYNTGVDVGVANLTNFGEAVVTCLQSSPYFDRSL